jgi:integrase
MVEQNGALEGLPEADPACDERRSVGAIDSLADWTGMARAAFAVNTIRAWKADWEIFNAYCRTNGLDAMPASAQTVRSFVLGCSGSQKKPATIRRYVATIGRAHRAAGVVDPTATEPVKLALKAMARLSPARQRQARGLVWADIEHFLKFEPRNLRDIRDRALVVVAYDTMCRREELVSLLIEDVAQCADGSGTVLVRRSKTDTTAEGAIAYLSPLTMRLLASWLQASMLKAGPLFARVVGRNGVGDALTAQILTAVFRKAGTWIGLPAEELRRISGHSARVGAAQDLLALNMDLPSVMQAGRWKDTRMPMRYGEKVLASRGAMARAAKEQGRA